MISFSKDWQHFLKFLTHYIRAKIIHLAIILEKLKNFLVDLLMLKRGILQGKIWHASMVFLLIFGLFTSGVFGGQTIVSSSYPGVGGENPQFAQSLPAQNEPILNSLYDTHTQISQKPRSETIEYEVSEGDTLSSVAEKFAVSVDTIKWANNMENINVIKPGQKLKILPVTGVSHTVVSGDTLESVAKKYSAGSQAILDFPFNDVPDDFKLKVGQVLVVPEGTPPQKAPVYRRAPQYIATSATFSAPGGANFLWPAYGPLISQYFAWYHPGIDIANRNAPPIAASDGGLVIVAGWPDNFGFGNRVVIDHENGYRTTYAHLSNIYVTVGQRVSRGQAIGQMGTTGRSTGIHLHFEIRYKGIAVNPLSILK